MIQKIMTQKDIKAVGVDLSQWNIVKSYDKLKSAGVQFAIIKESYGIDRKEPAFETHMEGCKKVGIPVIGSYIYCYSDTVEKANRAAYAFLENTKGLINTMILDLEDKAMRDLGGKIIDIINVYRNIAAANGMDFIIYTGASYYNPCLKKYENQIADVPIWWARYPDKKIRTITDLPSIASFPISNEVVGWQFSSKGTVGGVNGNIDLNIWYRNISNNDGKLGKITVDFNPFMEPTVEIKYGSRGDGAKWVQWYLWRFGLLADVKEIDGIIGVISLEAIKIAQSRLGLSQTGIVDERTRATFKKVC